MKNKKYILMISMFVVTYAIGLFYPSNFTAIIAPLAFIIVLYKLFKDDLRSYDFNQLKNETLQNEIFKTLIYAIGAQIILNGLIFFIFGKSHQSIIESTMTPFVPIATVLLAPILEEVICRKIIFGSLQSNKEQFSILAATISSLIFALGHFSAYGFLGYFAVGMVFCYFYFKTKNLITTIFPHMIFNFMVVLSQSIHMIWSGQ